MEDQVTARELLLLLAVSTMVICMAIGVVTFYVRKNIMLCAEWLVMFCSGCNVIAWFFTGNDWQWDLIWYLDAFSRIAGMNLLLYAGFATLTHNFRPTLWFDGMTLAFIAILALGFMQSDLLSPARHYAFSAAHFMFMPLLVFLVHEMRRINKPILSLLMAATTIMLTVSVVLLDFAAPANNDTNLIYNKDFISLMSWGFGYLIICKAYVAMDDHRSRARSEVGTA